MMSTHSRWTAMPLWHIVSLLTIAFRELLSDLEGGAVYFPCHYDHYRQKIINDVLEEPRQKDKEDDGRHVSPAPPVESPEKEKAEKPITSLTGFGSRMREEGLRSRMTATKIYNPPAFNAQPRS
jgi:hypothetical protein